jgi:isocitrate dehydrogenase
MKLEYYDLHVKHRDDTDDGSPPSGGGHPAIRHVGVKCATITPNGP